MVPMQLVACSPGPAGDDRNSGFERLVTELSTRFASLELDELPSALDHALEQTCLVMAVDIASVIELDENGVIETFRSRWRPGIRVPSVEVEPASWRWLTPRLADRQAVAISRLQGLPIEAQGEREYARKTGLCSMLAIPVAIGQRSLCALVMASAEQRLQWPAEAHDRARLLASVMGGALQR